MNLQDLDATAILIIVVVVFLFLLLRGGRSARSEDSEDDILILRGSQSKPCPRCGASVKPKWGDYYHCSRCGFGFTGTGRWTNGHMPSLLLEPLRTYGLIAMVAVALAATLFVTI